MSTWGVEPWETDSAADWLGNLVEECGLVKRVEEALYSDVSSHWEEIRAASFIVRVLARGFVWPSSDIARHRRLASQKLEDVLKSGRIESYEVIERIQEEIDELRQDIGPRSP